MSREKQINQGQVEAWQVIEALIKRHFEMSSAAGLAGMTNMNITKVRRILVTWEHLGLVERRGDLWRLSPYLTKLLPAKLQQSLVDTFKAFIPKKEE